MAQPLEEASEVGLDVRAQEMELKTIRDARALAPCTYEVFGVVYNGKLLSYRPMGGKTYHEMLEKCDERLLS
jgi:hypothetical protein